MKNVCVINEKRTKRDVLCFITTTIINTGATTRMGNTEA